jgi:hypothetical protein
MYCRSPIRRPLYGADSLPPTYCLRALWIAITIDHDYSQITQANITTKADFPSSEYAIMPA